jgi:hypothetical protein
MKNDTNANANGEPLRNIIRFCTACGEELEDFCFSDESLDPKAVKKHHEKCKKIGKYDGEMCSRLFIVDPDDPV